MANNSIKQPQHKVQEAYLSLLSKVSGSFYNFIPEMRKKAGLPDDAQYISYCAREILAEAAQLYAITKDCGGESYED